MQDFPVDTLDLVHVVRDAQRREQDRQESIRDALVLACLKAFLEGRPVAQIIEAAGYGADGADHLDDEVARIADGGWLFGRITASTSVEDSFAVWLGAEVRRMVVAAATPASASTY